MKKSKSIIDQYAEVSAAYTEAMQIVHQSLMPSGNLIAIRSLKIAHEHWVTMNSIKDMMTRMERREAIRFLAERAIKRSKK